jgi:hypothetical protein
MRSAEGHVGETEFSELDYRELVVLRGLYLSDSERFAAEHPAAFERYWTLVYRLAAVNQKREMEEAQQLAPRLTRARLAEIEQRTKDPNANLTGDELRLWHAAIVLSRPRNRILWRRWYREPLVGILFPPRAIESRRRPGRRPRGHRAVRRARQRSPGRDDADPHLVRRYSAPTDGERP